MVLKGKGPPEFQLVFGCDCCPSPAFLCWALMVKPRVGITCSSSLAFNLDHGGALASSCLLMVLQIPVEATRSCLAC